MSYIPATAEYGVVLRKAALCEKNVSRDIILEAMKDIDILGEDENLISWGPLFGQQALDEIRLRLSKTKLEYIDDYIDLDFLLPQWIGLGVAFNR
ncbi:UNVERIFIED_CONTAM: hypothetical protein Q9R58_24955 [Methylobacteriaceae bacterium AG10]|nr:hypothetical protein [Methylobacteriaceae bacterium AG10]